MGFFADALLAARSAGSISGAVTAVAKLANDALGMADKKQTRNDGANAQKVVTDEATIDTIVRVDAPISHAESDELWDRNKARFGAADPAGPDQPSDPKTG